MKTHFKAGDQIKYYPEGSGLVYYGDVIRVNKITITIQVDNYLKSVLRVDPSRLNFD